MFFSRLSIGVAILYILYLLAKSKGNSHSKSHYVKNDLSAELKTQITWYIYYRTSRRRLAVCSAQEGDLTTTRPTPDFPYASRERSGLGRRPARGRPARSFLVQDDQARHRSLLGRASPWPRYAVECPGEARRCPCLERPGRGRHQPVRTSTRITHSCLVIEPESEQCIIVSQI